MQGGSLNSLPGLVCPAKTLFFIASKKYCGFLSITFKLIRKDEKDKATVFAAQFK